MKINDNLKNKFNNDGFLVFRNLLTTDEALKWNSRCVDIADENGFSKNDEFAPSNLARFSQFHPIILEEKLLNILDQLIGKKACFTQQSDFQMNKDSGGWHRDSIHNDFGVGSDWDDTTDAYDCVRVIFYLGDEDVERQYLQVLPCSHVKNSISTRIEVFCRKKINSFLKRLNLPFLRRIEDICMSLFMNVEKVSTRPGDCVIFSQKLYHCAVKRPEFKTGIFLSYGSNSLHSRNLRGTFLYKKKYRENGYDEFPNAFKEKLTEMGRFVDATPTQG
jgi:hypothetical protein